MPKRSLQIFVCCIRARHTLDNGIVKRRITANGAVCVASHRRAFLIYFLVNGTNKVVRFLLYLLQSAYALIENAGH